MIYMLKRILAAISHLITHLYYINGLFLHFRFIKDKLSLDIHMETQLLFLCHLVGPFLQRFNSDLSRAVMDITLTLYELLAHIDKSQPHLTYIDPICDLLYPFHYFKILRTRNFVISDCISKLNPDFLNTTLSYHIKYMFVGDTMKNEVETVIRKLRPSLQMRLRFITHLNLEQINTA